MAELNIELAKLVIDEATAIKKHAKKSELESLNGSVDYLDPDSKFSCIYGQMTGNCFSTRANSLIIKCAKRVYSSGNEAMNIIGSSVLNGKPYEVTRARSCEYFSPIEVYIFKNKVKKRNQALLDYIKGKKETLKVEDLLPKKLLVES